MAEEKQTPAALTTGAVLPGTGVPAVAAPTLKKAFAYILGDGEIVTRDHLEKYRIKKQDAASTEDKKKDSDSGQLEEENWATLLQKNAVVSPPYDFRRLIQLLDNDSTHYRCFSKGTRILMEDFQEKKIEEIKIGDEIVTGTGEGKVIDIFKRRYKGKLVNIKATGPFNSISATAEHPIFSLKRSEIFSGKTKRKRMNPGYHSISHLSVGDYIAVPRLELGERKEIQVGNQKLELNKELGIILGCYLANGYVTYQKKCSRLVRFSYDVKKSDQVQRLDEAIKKLFGLKTHISMQKETSLLLRNSDKQFAEILESLGGKYAWGKRIRSDLFADMNKDFAIALLEAYFGGDGYLRKIRTQKWNCTTFAVKTVSEILARQVFYLLNRLGFTPVSFIQKPYQKNRRVYVVYLNGSQAERFFNLERVSRKDNYKSFVLDRYIFYRIRKKEETFYDDYVFNLEVTPDPSYVAESVIVHNCCKQKATDIAGRGWDIVPAVSPEKANPENRTKLIKFFSFCNPNESFLEVMKKCWMDYEAIGNLGLEVVRKDKIPVALYHIPFHTMRVCTDNNTYVQIRGTKKIRFRRFGTEEKLYKAWVETIGEVKDIPDSGHEIIHILNYHPCSSFYGVPDIISALGSLLGQIEARDYNLRFFENNAVPDYAIVIEGGEFTPESKKVIKAYFENELKGSTHRTLVLPVDEGVKVTFEKLTVEVRDSSFRLYRADNRDEIIRAHGIPPRRVGIAEAGGLGGTGEAKWQAENYKTSIVRPSQEILEYRINDFLINGGFGISDWVLQFSQIDLTDELEDARINEIYVKAGVKSVNEARGELGYDPLPGGEEPWVQTARGAVPLSRLGEIMEPSNDEVEKEDRKWYEDALERLREELHGFTESD